MGWPSPGTGCADAPDPAKDPADDSGGSSRDRMPERRHSRDLCSRPRSGRRQPFALPSPLGPFAVRSGVPNIPKLFPNNTMVSNAPMLRLSVLTD